MNENHRTVILFGSSNPNGNTRTVVDYVIEKTDFDLINLTDHQIGYFDYNFKHAEDDFLPMMERVVEDYDTLVFATPVYWYSMSAQMKTFFDRLSDLLHYKKEIGRKLRGKNMAMISNSGIDDRADGFSMPFEKSAEYLSMNYLGDIHTWGVENGQFPKEISSKLDGFIQQLQQFESA